MNKRKTLATCLAWLLVSTQVSLATPRDISAWKNEQPEQPESVLVKGATIWTSGPDGILKDADLLIKKGKIAKIGKGLRAPGNAVVIDASGKHVTPGLIDAHSHSAIIGGVNEGSNITTSEVRIADVVNSESIQIYRQLAGGLTTANLLHGSANSIGGQNAVIKLRWGATPEGLKFAGAPEGIKFALGENPKQSNFFNNENPRYPTTRAGVERSIRERFEAAQEYREEWAAHETDSSAVPPKRDLQLDALVEIMDGSRLVHAHSYRADEIVMLLRVAEDFGFTVASFQHVLEGYKVADELAAGNAGASSFSDWWAYKFEVVDAIPYNGAIMWDRDVVVSFNSDSSELARRMNTEAAKAVRYGGVPEDEALKFVTLNPAIQLGIQDRVGSLEKGKDADFVIWNGHPLSTYTICEQTWIDGRKYFDRGEDIEARQAIAAERQELMAKVRAAASEDADAEDADGAGGEAAAEEPTPTLPAYILADDDHSETCRHRDGEGGTR